MTLFSGNLPPGSVAGDARFELDVNGDRHRLWLTRSWDPTLPRAAFVGINPSVASGTEDDPTIRRCVTFAQREGWGSFVMLNLLSCVSSEPDDCYRASLCHGPNHLAERARQLRDVAVVVACWGANGTGWRWEVQSLLTGLSAPILCFGLTKAGQPRHPLYLRGDSPLVPYTQEPA